MSTDQVEKNAIVAFLDASKNILPLLYATVVTVGAYYALDKRISAAEDRARQYDIILSDQKTSYEEMRNQNQIRDLNFTAFKSSTDVKLANIEKTTTDTYELVKSYTRSGRN